MSVNQIMIGLQSQAIVKQTVTAIPYSIGKIEYCKRNKVTLSHGASHKNSVVTKLDLMNIIRAFISPVKVSRRKKT